MEQSSRCLDEKGCSVVAKKGKFKVLKSSQFILRGSIKNGLYCVDEPTSTDSFIPKTISVEERSAFECKSCVMVKITKQPFKGISQTASKPFEKIHLDLIGPIDPKSRERHRYILTVVDNFSGYLAGFPLVKKDDTCEALISLLKNECKRLGYYPTWVCSDGGGEFVGGRLDFWPAKTSGRKGQSHHLKGKKFHPKGEEGLLVGFDPTLLSCCILNSAGSIIKSKNVQFLKKPESSVIASNLDDATTTNQKTARSINPQTARTGAFLHAPLSEEVFIHTPKGCKRTSPYLKLKKALYGLKQAPKNWYETLTGWLKSVGFKELACNPCMYACDDGISFIFFHVDDLVLVGPGNDFKNKFADRFSNSACHPPNTLLGMKFEKIGSKICLLQPKHINHGLEELGLTECKPSSTPLTPNLQLREASDKDHEQFKKLNINYRSAIGLLNYIASNTRPDLSFAVSSLARYSVKPGLSHWKEVKKTWQYLCHTKDLKFTIYPVEPNQFLSIFSDATWGDDPNSRTSQSGYLCYFFGSLISWNSCR
ncbi:uncharacterized protein VP01_3129g2 [Puccinia sorghi]|uniref:Integrase catalytic domain-containing protein n=1 Tax=Puccinia sorghi TaxID=27349 RepID=A0A0L6UZA1_9BASI|nr:uncharacterized protein VP01_3129g2 [Puccinia sorghi]